jgi:hypothetical protein
MRGLSPSLVGGVDSGDKPWPGRLLISRRPIDLSRQKKIFDPFGFERRKELRWGRKVIFDGIGRPQQDGLSRPGMLWTMSSCTSNGSDVESPLT